MLATGSLPIQARASVELPRWPVGREAFEFNGDRFEIVGRVTWTCGTPARAA
jgi:hypothetical protein